jgi:hypothetical protein
VGQQERSQLSKERGTPLIEGELLSTSSQIPENLEGLTETVGTLGLQVSRRNSCGAAKRRSRKAGLVEAPIGLSSGYQPRSAPGGQTQTQQGPAHLGLNEDEDLLWFSGRPRREEGVCEAQANGSCRPGPLRGVGRTRGPCSVGSLAVPELLGRASGWLLMARITQRVKSLGRTFLNIGGGRIRYGEHHFFYSG